MGKHFAAIVVLLVAVGWLFQQGSSTYRSVHNDLRQTIADLSQVDAALKADVLTSRGASIGHFDALNASMNATFIHFDQLSSLSRWITGPDGESIHQLLLETRDVVQLREQSLERFKSELALYRNSLHYVTHLISQLAPTVGTDTVVQLSALSNMVLTLDSSPESYRRADVSAVLDKLQQAAKGSPSKSRITVLVKHVRLLVDTLPGINQSIGRLVAPDLSQQLRRLQSAYALVSDRTHRYSELSRFAILAIAVVLLGYLTVVFRRSRRGVIEIQSANRRLKEEIANRRRSDSMMANQNMVLTKLVRGDALEHVLASLCLGVETLIEDSMGSVSLASDDGRSLVNGIGPSLPPDYAAAMQGLLVAEGSGSCGTAACRMEPVYVEDIAVDPLWADFVDLAREHNIHACWAIPLISHSGALFGTIAVSLRHPAAPTDSDKRILQSASSLASLAIERRRAEQDLFEEKERAEVTLHSIGDGVVTTDRDGTVEYMNPVAEALTGLSLDKARGRNLSQVLVLRDEVSGEDVSLPVENCIRDEIISSLSGNTLLIGRDGQEFYIEQSVSPIRHRDGSIGGAVAVFSDISESRALTKKIAFQASHDSLTGLVNRREFEDRLDKAIVSARSGLSTHALCYLDLDNFKIVNDSCGHAAGDALLKELAQKLGQRVYDHNVLGRLGGDEFGVLMLDCAIAKANIFAEDLLTAVREFRFSYNSSIFEVGVSIGLIEIAEGTVDRLELMALADVACYAAKDAGRNRIHLHQQEDDELKPRLQEITWASQIDRCIKENRFKLYCQKIRPAFNDDREHIHYEVLLRMVNDDGTLVLPEAFIPASERYGVMSHADRWVISATFAEIARLDAAGVGEDLGFGLSINLSGNSLSDDGLLTFVRSELARHAISPERVCFEITETAAITHLELATDIIRELRRIGCQFALDDFGSGLSSFSYLKQLPVDYLKIDGSFVLEMINSDVDAAMVSAINEVGHAMGIATVAESVEDATTLDRLRGIGVDLVQGYHIERPFPLDQLKQRVGDGGSAPLGDPLDRDVALASMSPSATVAEPSSSANVQSSTPDDKSHR